METEILQGVTSLLKMCTYKLTEYNKFKFANVFLHWDFFALWANTIFWFPIIQSIFQAFAITDPRPTETILDIY